MTARVFPLPDLGEGLTEAEIVRWLVAVGDRVDTDQSVVEVETAKAVVDVPTPYAGTVTELGAAAGAVLDVGATLLVIEDGAASAPDPAPDLGPEAARYVEEERAGSGNVLVGYGTSTPARRRRPTPTPSPRPSPSRAATARPLVISPVVRRLARDHAVDLTTLEGSGPDGLIVRADVERAINPPAEPSALAGGPPSGGPLPISERIPLKGARRAAAEAFTRSRREIPEATTWVDVDATALVQARRDINARSRTPIGLLPLIARFVVAGLARHPELNSRVDATEIVRFDGVNLGVAAQSERGLLVPVIKNAHRHSARGLQDELTRLTGAARAGTLGAADLTGGTFTLNNYGVFGVDGSAPIVNHPEAAILGIGRIIDRPWVVDGEVTARKIVQLSLAFDHRVCDGAPAAAFLRFIADCFEDPQEALTHL
ncbi:dihydrolipoamide acetyltransferase family protein [Spirillospora sp. NBC_01491]|uniref:dihydrolipoamide acetyltransferase family protein n=1 Tax=Spirillospora sp. NBC_01491 TaxID=2976007 RepID=UPI002E35F95E|nr:dihydrolipoamide acetyltransferase family protein [Spirillospora sp. NBC_01491]